MTNEQAIRALHYVRESFALDVDSYEALNMAIEALRFVDEYHQSNIEAYAHDMGVSLEQAERELRVEELSCSEEPNNSDLISRQDFDKFLENAEKEAAKNRKYVFASALNTIRGNLRNFPSPQPEVKPISYTDCANAMLMMWMDHVLTDGEYNRIMDKLNAHEMKKGEENV